jgi:type IV pilus assembly protein PilC
MAMFRYEAVDRKSGLVLRGSMEAANAQEAQLRLSERGYRNVSIEVNRPPAAKTAQTASSTRQNVVSASIPKGGLNLAPTVSAKDLGIFFRQMTSLLHSGFTPLSALSDLAPRTANRRIANAITDAASIVAKGEPMSSALARHQDVFPHHVIGLIQAGEMGGVLEYACEEAALGAESDAALRNGIWVTHLLVWQSVWTILIAQPLFNHIKDVFNGLGAFLLMGKDFLFIFLPIGIGIHLLVLLGGLFWRQPFAVEQRDRLLLMVPASRKLARNRALASFTRMLRRLLLSGISPEMAYSAAAQAVPNLVLRNQLMQGVSVLRSGHGLDAAIQATGMMEHDPVQMLVTGQKTGQWTEMLDRVTAYYQDQAAKSTENAKTAQKRFGVLITILSTGYFTIALAYSAINGMWSFVGDIEKG